MAYQLQLDPNMAADTYTVAVRVVDAEGETVAVSTQPRRPAGVLGEPDAVPLRRIQIR